MMLRQRSVIARWWSCTARRSTWRSKWIALWQLWALFDNVVNVVGRPWVYQIGLIKMIPGWGRWFKERRIRGGPVLYALGEIASVQYVQHGEAVTAESGVR